MFVISNSLQLSLHGSLWSNFFPRFPSLLGLGLLSWTQYELNLRYILSPLIQQVGGALSPGDTPLQPIPRLQYHPVILVHLTQEHIVITVLCGTHGEKRQCGLQHVCERCCLPWDWDVQCVPLWTTSRGAVEELYRLRRGGHRIRAGTGDAERKVFMR